MFLKKREDMNYYEILQVEPSASQQDIESAYHMEKSSYQVSSLAHYGLIDDEERKAALKKVEDAFQTLRSPKKRKSYDAKTLKYKTESSESAYFRNSTEKLIIEDGEKKRNLGQKIKRILLFFSPKK